MTTLLGYLWVTSCHLRSRDVIFCNVTASFCQLQPCRKQNVQYSKFLAFFSHFLVIPVKLRHFRSPEVTWHHFLSRDYLLLPAIALQEEKCTVYGSFWNSTTTSRWLPVECCYFRVTSGHLMSFLFTWMHLPATYSNVESDMYSIREFLPFYSHFLMTYGQMTSLLGHFRSPEVTWRHFLSCNYLFLRVTAL